MKKILICLSLVTLIAGCDAPTRTRFQDPGTISGGSASGDGNNNGGGDEQDKGGGATEGGSNNTQTGYENCNLASTNYVGTLGYFGICQHSSDERGFKFKFALKAGPLGTGSCTSTNCGACFIPMHLSTSGGSYALGPAQCVHHEANKEYFGTFQKANNAAINSIMVIHRYSVDSFFQCMGAYDQYIAQCGMHPNCQLMAQQYANQVCQSFVANHGQNYKQVHFNY